MSKNSIHKEGTLRNTIYMINVDLIKEDIILKNINSNIIKEKLTVLDCVEFLGKKYENKYVNETDIKISHNYKYQVFVRKNPVNKDKTEKFLKNIIKPNVLTNIRNTEISIILLIFNEKYIFALTIGHSSADVIKYTDDYFGVKILGKIIDEHNFEINSKKVQGVNGLKKYENSHYRGGYSYAYVNEIEKIIKELNGKVKKDAFPEEIQKIGKDRNITITAKASISISNKISLSQVELLISWFIEVLENNKENVILNGIKFIKINSSIYNNYFNRVRKKLWEKFQEYMDDKTTDCEIFDIINRDSENYYSASDYLLSLEKNEITKDNPIKISDIFDLLGNDLCEKEFNEKLNKIVIKSKLYDENFLLTSDKFTNHLSGEIPAEESDDGKYILIDGLILQLDNNYIKKLNKKLNDEIKKLEKFNYELPCWNNSGKEDEYIKNSYLDDKFLIIHPKKINYIELCDVIFFDNEIFHFIFIKKDFNYNVRDLANQIFVSKKLCLDNKIEDYLSKLFEKLLEHKTKISSNFSRENLLNGIRNNKISFIFAVYDDKQRNLEDMTRFDSNIAKISLDSLIKDFKDYDFKLKITSIRN